MKKATLKKLLSSFLALVMVLGMLPAAVFAADFDDTQGHWGQAAIERWAGYGVLNGDETGNFNPDKEMTRAEFAQMLSGMMGYTEKSEKTFADVPADAWYADAMLKLVEAGVMSGMGDGTLAPNTPITREQTAVLLCNALDIKPSGSAGITFSDAGSVSNWAQDAVAALTERDMISGMGDGTFAPGRDINRASVSQMVSNMVAEYVTEDGATITGEVNGIVIVKADNVKIEDATLKEPVIVAPAAADATVSLTGTTSAADVVVAAEGAKVVVAETASAKAVEVEAPKAGAEIAGKVETVVVETKAADAAVTVDASGSVDSISSAGAEAKVSVAGTVKDVTVTGDKAAVEITGKAEKVAVAETASSAAVTVAKGAEVDSVTSAGTEAKVSVAGTVKDVTVSGSKTDVEVSGKVEKVDVAASASDTGIKTQAGAKVDNVTAASDVNVSGASGTVGSVTATGEADAKVDVPKTQVKNEGTGKVTAGSKPVDPGKSETANNTGSGSSGSSGSSGNGGSQKVTVTLTADPTTLTARGSVTTIKLTASANYASSVSASMFTLSGDAATGLSVAGAVREDDKNVSITLNAAPSTAGTLTITAAVGAFATQPTTAPTVNITVNPAPVVGFTRAQAALLIQQHPSLDLASETSTEWNKFEDIDDCSPEQKNAIGVLVERGYINGTSETTFAPDGVITRGQAAIIISRIAETPTVQGTDTPYADVENTEASKDEWYFGPIRALYALGILKADDAVDGINFAPDEPATAATVTKWLDAYGTYKTSGFEPLTRAEIARLIHQHPAFGLPAGPTENYENPFTDIDNCTNAQKNAIGVLNELRFVTGTGTTTFSPSQIATRADVATLIGRIAENLGVQGTATLPYGDVVSDAWYCKYISVLYAMSVLTEDDVIEGTNFAPYYAATAAVVSEWFARYDEYIAQEASIQPITRAELAEKIYEESAFGLPEALEGEFTVPFTDIEDEKYDNQRTAIGILWQTGVVRGTSSTTFTPDGYASQVEAAIVIWRAHAYKNGKSDVVTTPNNGTWYDGVVDALADMGVLEADGFAPFMLATTGTVDKWLENYAKYIDENPGGEHPTEYTVTPSNAADAKVELYKTLDADGKTVSDQIGDSGAQIAEGEIIYAKIKDPWANTKWYIGSTGTTQVVANSIYSVKVTGDINGEAAEALITMDYATIKEVLKPWTAEDEGETVSGTDESNKVIGLKANDQTVEIADWDETDGFVVTVTQDACDKTVALTQQGWYVGGTLGENGNAGTGGTFNLCTAYWNPNYSNKEDPSKAKGVVLLQYAAPAFLKETNTSVLCEITVKYDGMDGVRPVTLAEADRSDDKEINKVYDNPFALRLPLYADEDSSECRIFTFYKDDVKLGSYKVTFKIAQGAYQAGTDTRDNG